jgi:hypothetical protein
MESGPKHLLGGGSGQSLFPQSGLFFNRKWFPFVWSERDLLFWLLFGCECHPISWIGCHLWIAWAWSRERTTKGGLAQRYVNSDWDFALPHSVETPEHLAIICPPANQRLIPEGVYINLASFIPKEAWEESTSTLNWSFSEGAMKQTNIPRQIKDIDEWTDAFMKYAGIYCQAHPMKSVEMWRYGDIIRQAKRKWRAISTSNSGPSWPCIPGLGPLWTKAYGQCASPAPSIQLPL